MKSQSRLVQTALGTFLGFLLSLATHQLYVFMTYDTKLDMSNRQIIEVTQMTDKSYNLNEYYQMVGSCITEMMPSNSSNIQHICEQKAENTLTQNLHVVQIFKCIDSVCSGKKVVNVPYERIEYVTTKYHEEFQKENVDAVTN